MDFTPDYSVQLYNTQLTIFFAFPYTLSSPTFARSTYKCFVTSTCMAIAEIPPPSNKEHCLYLIESSNIKDSPCVNLFPSWTAFYAHFNTKNFLLRSARAYLLKSIQHNCEISVFIYFVLLRI